MSKSSDYKLSNAGQKLQAIEVASLQGCSARVIMPLSAKLPLAEQAQVCPLALL